MNIKLHNSNIVINVFSVKKCEREYHGILYTSALINNEYTLFSKDKLIYECKRCSKHVECKFSYDYDKFELQLCSDCRCIDTNMKKYGVHSPMQLEKTREKSRITCRKNLGVDYPSQSKIVQEKNIKTCQKNFNVDHPSQSKLIQEKFKITCRKNFGVDHPMQSDIIKEIHRETCRKNLGVDHPLKSIDISGKIRSTSRKIFYKNLISGDRLDGLVKPNFREEEFLTVKKRYQWICTKCNLKFMNHLNNGIIPRCPQCFPRKMTPSSILEKEIVSFIKLKNLNVIENTRKIIPSLELDIYIPSYNLAIEFNGTYWHSSGLKEKWYHQYKTELCYRLGIRLLHIYEWEWSEKREECENRIIYYLNNMKEQIKSRKPKPRFILNGCESDRKNYEVLIWD